jgi:hypothetical protein
MSWHPPCGAWACPYFRMQPYLPTSLTGGTTGRAAETVQGALENEVPPGGVPATSTESESGPHTVSNPYPASDVQARQIAVNEKRGIGVRLDEAVVRQLLMLSNLNGCVTLPNAEHFQCFAYFV